MCHNRKHSDEKMQQYRTVFLRVMIALALVAALSVHPLGTVRATSNTPVYVLGVSNATDPLIIDLQSLTSSVNLLNSVTSLTTISTGSILYIDGSWLATTSSQDPTVMPTIVQAVLAGLPTVVVRGDPSILVNSISGLMKLNNPGLPLIAEGVHVTGTLASGVDQGALLRVISGFDYSVSAEFQWAVQQIPQSGPLPLLAPLADRGQSASPAGFTQDQTGPYWLLLLQASSDTGNFFSPYGQVITTFSLYGLQNSGSTSSKWFDIFTNQTVTPGAVAFNSNYRNYLETTNAHPNNQTTNIFVSNGPATQINSGPSTITYTIGSFAGTSNATITSTQTMSYSLKNSNVTNTSSYPNVGWIHTIAGGTSAGKLTLQYIPGWTDEVAQGHPLTINGDLATTFATFNNSATPTSTATTDLTFEIFGG
jgi:hypothetical protein